MSFVNETNDVVRRVRVMLDPAMAQQKYRVDVTTLRPGDVVRRQLYESDRDSPPGRIPVGLVLWVRDSRRDHEAVGILWSGDPSA